MCQLCFHHASVLPGTRNVPTLLKAKHWRSHSMQQACYDTWWLWFLIFSSAICHCQSSFSKDYVKSTKLFPAKALTVSFHFDLSTHWAEITLRGLVPLNQHGWLCVCVCVTSDRTCFESASSFKPACVTSDRTCFESASSFKPAWLVQKMFWEG